MRFPSALVALSALFLTFGGVAHAASTPETAILEGLTRAVKDGRMPADDASVDRTIVRRAARLWRTLPSSRGWPLKAVVDTVAAQASRYNRPRALALFGMLSANANYLAQHAPTGEVHQDITDANGVVYRYFPGHGFQFHPLGNAVMLNSVVSIRDDARTRQLADALIARGVPNGPNGLVWEYYFAFGGGHPPWTSGMAQAQAAQGLARASSLLGDPSLAHVASRAWRAIPERLVRPTSFGPWIRLYSFDNLVVLNAQLQAAISLGAYATIAEDDEAAELAARMRAAAAAALPSFDTGFWSFYALPSVVSPVLYHRYVISLLRTLSSTDPRFAAAATRFVAYTKQPPAFQFGDPGGDGILFWLSKPGQVAVQIGDDTRRYSLGAGWHRVGWPLGSKAGAFHVHLAATDYLGNRADATALPVVRTASVGGPKRDTVAAAPLGPPSFLVGAGIDVPAQARAAVAAGLTLVRLVVPWQPGETEPAPEIVAALNSVHTGRLVVELTSASPHVTLAPFVASLVQQVTDLSDLVVVPSNRAAADYVTTLGAVHDAVADTGAAVRVAGTVRDTASLAALGDAFEVSGRKRPIMDEVSFRAAALPDYKRIVAALGSAFDGTRQPGASLPILWDRVGTATKVAAAKAALYTPEATAAEGVGEPQQANAYAAALKLSACQPTVTGVLFDRLVDGPAVGAQDGLFYPDGSAKASLAPMKPLLAQARRGTIAVCPGLGARVAATQLELPEKTDYPAGTRNWLVRVGCSRDCLYLVTLDRASSGVPMLAKRGALGAGGTPTPIVLSGPALPAGAYRFTVRLISRVNPGPLFAQRGPIFRVGS